MMQFSPFGNIVGNRCVMVFAFNRGKVKLEHHVAHNFPLYMFFISGTAKLGQQYYECGKVEYLRRLLFV